MYGFDIFLFEEVYKKAMEQYNFSTVFQEIFVPFLNFVGLFWHTDTVTIPHEHFITNLIYQKILLQIEKLEYPIIKSDKYTFILFLPEEEMHEIGLLYLNYELLLRGYKTIYLGRSVPIKDLSFLIAQFSMACFISTFTINPEKKKLAIYLADMIDLIQDTSCICWAISRSFNDKTIKSSSDNIQFFSSPKEVLSKIESHFV